MNDQVERMSAGRRAWLDIVHAWPVILSVLGLVTLLISTYGTAKMTEIADARILANGATPIAAVTALEARQGVIDFALETNSDDVTEVKATVIRVEGKLDDLILLMQARAGGGP